MESSWFNIFGIAGIGGIAFASVVYIFREIIRKQIFPQLSNKQAYALLNRIISLSFILGVLGILAYSFSIFINQQKDKTNDSTNDNTAQMPSPISTNKANINPDIPTNSNSYNTVNNLTKITSTPFQTPTILTNNAKATDTPVVVPVTSVISGTVLDEDGKNLQGVKVTVEDFPNSPSVQTNSDGIFNLINIPKQSGEGIRIRIFKDGYNEQIKDIVIGARPRKIYLEKIK